MAIECVNVYVNDIKVECQPDSASDINIWGNNHFRTFCNELGYKPKLQRASRPIRAANKTLIKVNGFFNSTNSPSQRQGALKSLRIFLTRGVVGIGPFCSKSLT